MVHVGTHLPSYEGEGRCPVLANLLLARQNFGTCARSRQCAMSLRSWSRPHGSPVASGLCTVCMSGNFVSVCIQPWCVHVPGVKLKFLFRIRPTTLFFWTGPEFGTQTRRSPGTMLPCGTVLHRPGHTTQYTKYYFLQRSFHPAIGFLLLPLH